MYHYILNYFGHFSFCHDSNGNNVGVTHADDLLYTWNYRDYAIFGTDIKVQRIMTEAWTNFATYGDPTPPGISNFSWTPLQNISFFEYFSISGKAPAMEFSEYLQSRMDFWKQTIG